MLYSLLEWMNIDYQLIMNMLYKIITIKSSKINKHASIGTYGNQASR